MHENEVDVCTKKNFMYAQKKILYAQKQSWCMHENEFYECTKTKLMYARKRILCMHEHENKVYWVEAVCRGVYPDQRHNDNNSLQM